MSKRNGSYIQFDNGTIWPAPDDPKEVEWRLRYGNREQLASDHMLAASYVSAYRTLVSLPAKRRAAVIRELRAVMQAEPAKEEP